MAALDFDNLIDASALAGTFIGGDDGSQIVNATLPSPLTINGSDCRHYVANNPGQERGLVRVLNDPLFASIPDTQAISVRAWVRMDLNTGVFHQQAIGIFVKGGTQPLLNGQHGGYSLGIGSLKTWKNHDGTNAAFTQVGAGMHGNNPGTLNTKLPNIGVYVPGTWVQLRIDVLPVKNGPTVDRDQVDFYWNTGTEASPVWTLLNSTVILNSDPAYAVWGNVSVTRVGYFVHSGRGNPSPDARDCYIDGFDARAVTV